MQLPYSDQINTGHLARLFDNTSECYKLFWFKAIVVKVREGKTVLSYEELIDKMITDAWYMVTEYHLNLGPNDTLEKVIIEIKKQYPELKPSEKETQIQKIVSSTNDKEILKMKRTLTYNVPYHLLHPFLPGVKISGMNRSEFVSVSNQEKRILYYFDSLDGMNSRIVIHDEWAEYIKNNYEIILGWIEYHMIHYLQRRNPSVPGIADKLSPPEERKLDKVKKYWKLIMSYEPVIEIYNGQELSSTDISIDHFVPWSYVAHDELWNLNPTTRKINSSKSNNLPDWDSYFNKLAAIEYQSYRLMWTNENVNSAFNNLAREHINNEEVRARLYGKDGFSLCEFAKSLETVVYPVYKAAQECGFSSWEYKGTTE